MAQSNADRQKAWRDRQREAKREEPVDPDELAALTEILGSALCAGALIDRYSDLRTTLQAPTAEIRQTVPAADAGRVVRKLAALKTAVLAYQRAELREAAIAPTLTDWEKVITYLYAHNSRTEETFHCLYLDRKNQLIAHDKQTGTIAHCPVYVREIVRRALDIGACALVLSHNHPSGDPQPSRADIAVTRDIITAGKTVDITVHDHIIIGQGRHVSFRDLGLF